MSLPPPTALNNAMQDANSLVSPVMRTVVSSGDDALNLLFKAADVHASGHAVTTNHPEGKPSEQQNSYDGTGLAPTQGPSPAQHGGLQSSNSPLKHRLPDSTSAALDVWRVCRFVKQGWFSPTEAILLVDLCVLIPSSQLLVADTLEIFREASSFYTDSDNILPRPCQSPPTHHTGAGTMLRHPDHIVAL